MLTDTEEQTRWCIDRYKEWKKEAREGAELLGIHLEGPFLAPAYKGAMPEHLLRHGDAGLLRSYQEQAEGGIRYLTVSPEVEGTVDMIPAARELGIVTAIGHSGADYDTAMSAIAAGAQAATHTFNAMLLLHQHRPAILGAVLESDVYCEAICDGRHLHPGIVRLLLKVKGLDRVVAITDSIMAAGLPDGKYHLGVNEVVVEDGDNAIAPSAKEAIGKGGGNKFQPGGLESSTADVATEFANMIVTQRGYQANTRIITVTDSMLEELVNMKR